MRFTRKKQITTTIFNKELSNVETIRMVFSNMHSHGVEFSMIMRKFMPSEYDYINLSFEQVRIKSINDDGTLDLLTFKKGIKTTMRNIPLSNISEVNVITRQYAIIDVDDALTRWEILDL